MKACSKCKREPSLPYGRYCRGCKNLCEKLRKRLVREELISLRQMFNTISVARRRRR